MWIFRNPLMHNSVLSDIGNVFLSLWYVIHVRMMIHSWDMTLGKSFVYLQAHPAVALGCSLCASPWNTTSPGLTHQGASKEAQEFIAQGCPGCAWC